MLKEKETLERLETFLDVSPIPDTEVIFDGWAESTTRFTNNLIHQNVTEENSSVTVRTIEDGRIGSVTTNQLDLPTIRKTISNAVTRMREHPRVKVGLELREPRPYTALNNFDAQAAAMSAHERASIVDSIIKQASEHGLVAAGALVTGQNGVGVVNSKGIRAFHRESHFKLTLTVFDQNGGSGWTMVEGTKADLDMVQSKVSHCIKRTILNRKPRKIEPGRYTVILEPPATGTLLEFLGFLTFGAKEYLLGRSFFHNRLQQQITGNLVTIHDDAYHPLTLGMPFDFEGSPRQRVTLIERGIATGLVHDSATAKQMNTETTGHSLPQPNEVGPMPFNLVMEPGSDSLDRIIAETEDGILITRFHYNRVVDGKNTVITGLTRDGTFAVRDGEIVFPLNNLRYNTNILNAFSRIERISADHYLVGEYGKVVAPALKIRDFLFTDVSG